MSAPVSDLTERLYSLVSNLPRFDHETPATDLPLNAVYFFFERGERITLNGKAADRIVMVSTDTADNRFPVRIRQHYGNVNSLRGNKDGSILRQSIGGALMRRVNPDDLRLADWLTHGGRSFVEVEEMVSLELRNNFTFACFRVDSAQERLSLKKGLIALLAQYPLGNPSSTWLGRFAADEKIGESGLWNSNLISGEPLSMAQLQRVETLIRRTTGGIGA